MEDKKIDQTNRPEHTEPEILVNDYGATKDPAVVIDEADRTVLLTENDTIVIEKGPSYDIVPKDRPRKVYAGMWGQAEIATVGLAVLAVLSVILLYALVVVPSGHELDRQKAERNRLEGELATAQGRYGDMTSVEGRVAKLVESVDSFEANYLPVASSGRTALYQRINGLLAGYGLVNISGPDFAPLDMAEMTEQEGETQERGRAKFKSLFPGVYVTMTVEGSYQNIRRFIREIETGREFVIISSVELEPSDSQREEKDPADAPEMQAPQMPQMGNPIGPGRNPRAFTDRGFAFENRGGFPGARNPGGRMQPMQQQPVMPRPAAPKGKTHGEVVSLRLEMAAYFRRANMMPAVETSAQ